MPKFNIRYDAKVNDKTDTLEINAPTQTRFIEVCNQLIKDAESFYKDECIVNKILIELLW